jgi:hypothetical protein
LGANRKITTLPDLKFGPPRTITLPDKTIKQLEYGCNNRTIALTYDGELLCSNYGMIKFTLFALPMHEKVDRIYVGRVNAIVVTSMLTINKLKLS